MARDETSWRRYGVAADTWQGRFAQDDEQRDAGGRFSSGGGGGGGGAGPAGHEQLHKRLTESGHKYRETPTHHIWFNPKAGTQTEVPKSKGATNKPLDTAKPWYHKIEQQHGPSREGPGGSRVTGAGFQQRHWQAPKAG